MSHHSNEPMVIKFVAGGIASCTAEVVSLPLDMAKVRINGFTIQYYFTFLITMDFLCAQTIHTFHIDHPLPICQFSHFYRSKKSVINAIFLLFYSIFALILGAPSTSGYWPEGVQWGCKLYI